MCKGTQPQLVSSVQVPRRAALGLIAGAAALSIRAEPSQAAYGESARVFASKITNKSGTRISLMLTRSFGYCAQQS